jgi:hypothetical protein
MGFANVFAGWQDAAHEHYKNILQMQYEDALSRRQQYAKFADDERYPAEARSEMARRALIPIIDDNGNFTKESKEEKNFTIQVQPPKPPSIQAPGTPGTPPSPGAPSAPPSPDGSGGSPGAPQGYAQAEVNPQTVQPPAPPPHMQSMFQQLPFEQQIAQERQHSLAKEAGPLEGIKYRAAIPQKLDIGTMQDPNDPESRLRVATMHYIDPNTGQYTSYQQVMGKAPFFAIRNGGEITVGELTDAVKTGAYHEPWGPDGKVLDLSKFRPDQVLRHIDSNRYELVTQPTQIKNFQGSNVGFNPVGGTIGRNYGPAIAPARPGYTSVRPYSTGVGPDGKPTYGPGVSTTTPNIPPPSTGLFTPTPYGNQVNMPAFGSSISPTPFTGGPSATGGPPPAGPMGAEPPSPPPGSVALPAPGQGQRPGTVQSPPGSVDRSVFNREQNKMQALRPAISMLIGSPENPSWKPLSSFASLYDDPKTRQVVGDAFRVIVQQLGNIESREGPKAALGFLGTSISPGSIPDIVSTYLGLPQLHAAAETTAIEQAMAPLSEPQKQLLTRLIGAYGTVVGFRAVTSGSSLQFSTSLMEKELPVPGVGGVNDSKGFYDKIATLINEPMVTVSHYFSVPQGEKDFYQKAAQLLTIKGGWEQRRQDAQGNYIYGSNGHWYNENGDVVR